MNKIFLFSFLLTLLVLPLSCTDDVVELKVMTFNIRISNLQDGHNEWQYRKNAAAQIIKDENIDIVGMQEVLVSQLTDMAERLPDYNFIHIDDDGNGIFYKKERFEILDHGIFWISETPEIQHSRGWDGFIVRTAIWAILKEIRTGVQIFVINTHLDHIGMMARQEGVKLLLDRILSLHKGLPIIITGDFNDTENSTAMLPLFNRQETHLVHTRDVAKTKEGVAGTFHSFGAIPENKRSLVDYIFVSEFITVLKYSVLPDMLDNVFLSDHAPVVAHIILPYTKEN